MHNCRLTKNRLLDLALDEVAPSEAKQLLEDLDDCPACQEEYATLKNTWRVSAQALRSALPTEDFWPGHHARLQARLINASSLIQPVHLSLSSRWWIGLRKMATTSVRVPLPAALAMMLLIGISFFALGSTGQTNIPPVIPLVSLETRTVPVPVIQEKVVTRVVYIERKGRGNRGAAGQSGPSRSNVAGVRSDASGKTAMSLVGFKPTDHVNLTIIKGVVRNEK